MYRNIYVSVTLSVFQGLAVEKALAQKLEEKLGLQQNGVFYAVGVTCSAGVVLVHDLVVCTNNFFHSACLCCVCFSRKKTALWVHDKSGT